MASGLISTRLATPADAPAIAAIYNEGIADRVATFETEPRTSAQLEAQLRDKGDRFPTMVAEREGRWVYYALDAAALDALVDFLSGLRPRRGGVRPAPRRCD